MNSVLKIRIKSFTIQTFILLTFYLSPSFGNAQAPQEQPEFKLAVPPSPNASAFMQYGNYPVVLNTGTIPISIPLYEINTGKIVVPISVDYHASGIKVSQLASSIGLGWTLNAGGIISRVMKGLPDETSQTGYFSISSLLKPAANFNYSIQQDRETLKALVDGDYDASPDKFQINILGLNVQFSYDKNKNEVVTPFQQIKIEGGVGDNLDHYTVTDEAGTIYRFGKSFLGADTKEVSQALVKGPDPDPYVSSWYVTEIISADRSDTVFFEYESINIGLYSVSRSQIYQHAFQYSGNLPDGNGVGYATQFGHQSTLYSTSQFHELSLVSVTTQSVTNSMNIKTIKYRGGKVEFVNTTYLTGLKRIDQVVVYEKDASSPTGYSEMKRYNLAYSNFAGPVYRLKLLNLTEGKGAAMLPAHKFYYHEEVTMPEFDSPNCDMWGYYNGASNSSFIPVHSVYGGTFGDANRNVDSVYTKAYSLNKIVYPTGGYSKFYFEPHILGTNLFGGGLRVNKIVNFDQTDESVKTKTYKYEGAYLVASSLINTYQTPNEVVENYVDVVTGGPIAYSWEYQTAFANSSYYNAPAGSPISYKKVIEFQGTETINVGKTEYEFWEIQDYGESYSYPFPELHSNAELRSKQIKQSQFKSLGSQQYQKLSEEISTYSLHQQGESSGLMVRWMIQQQKEKIQLPNVNNAYNGYLYVQNEFQRSNFIQLNQTEKIDNLLNTKTTYSYSKKPTHFQVTSVETTNSNNVVSSKQFKYPKDYAEISGLTTPEIQAYQKMNTDNVIRVPIQTTTLQNGNLENKITTTYKLVGTVPVPENYKIEYPGSIFKTLNLTFNTQLRLTQTTPQNDVVDAYIWNTLSTKPVAKITNATIAQVAYTSFEADGKGGWNFAGIPTTEITPKAGGYCYKPTSAVTRTLSPGTYKLQFWAKGTVTLSGVTAIAQGTPTQDNSGWYQYEYEINVTATSVLTISGNASTYIDELRIFPALAQITTYVYGSAIGMIATADTNNVVSYYEYDTLGRLQIVRDNNRNIMRRMEYHYKGQN